MTYKTLQLSITNLVAYLHISRPKSLNALNLELFNELETCLTSLKTQKLRAVIVQGAGDKAFVAGADIKEMASLNKQQAEEFSKKGQEVFSILESLPCPVIAVIQGFALGGGLELALACDILLMDKQAKIGLPETSLGLVPSFGGTQKLIRAVGFYKAKEMIFTGAFYTAQEAYDMGLVTDIAGSKGELLDKAEKLVSVFKKRGALALSKAKYLIQKSHDVVLQEGLKLESQEFAKLCANKEAQEGMQAFIEKRSARFNDF